jgi:hypothetical protein
MNKTIGLQLVLYGLLLAGLSYLVHYLAPALARPTFITGLIGGSLCLAWGLLAFKGSHFKALSLLTLVPVNFALLSQTVIVWTGGNQEVTGRQTAAAVITILLFLSVGMLMRIAYTEMDYDGQPTTTAGNPAGKNQAPGKFDQANAGKAKRI